jgi:hypothetical protein
MTKKQPRIPANLQPWIDARRKFRLSHEHVQMARELGMNPKKLGKLDNHDQEPWKLSTSSLTRAATLWLSPASSRAWHSSSDVATSVCGE